MNQEKIGTFIAERRREAGLTQAALGERLGVTDRAVSKWETGRSLPDIALMPELCGALGININELLAGEVLDRENYQRVAEERLLELRRQEEISNRKLLGQEVVLMVVTMGAFLGLLLTGMLLLEGSPWQDPVIALGTVLLVVGVLFGVKIEAEAGYYECPHCGGKHIPTFLAALMAPHVFRARKLRCPHCGQRGYHRKTLT